MEIKISLCIPTKNRFDNFLSRYLDTYLEYLKLGLIDEIIVNDENGNDFDKIMNKYGDYIINNNNFRVYKNENVLGVFKNKLKVCSYSTNNYIALIDSDNFANNIYFTTVKEYIKHNAANLSETFILAPFYARPHAGLDYTEFENKVITVENIKQYCYNDRFLIALNTGNYIITKTIIDNIKYNSDIMNIITSCDVIYFNLLVFQQFPEFQMHVVKDLEYLHIVHDDSEYLKTHHNCDNTLNNFIIPEYKKL